MKMSRSRTSSTETCSFIVYNNSFKFHRETRSLGLAIRKRLYASASSTSRPRIRVCRVGRALFRETWRTTSECCSFRLPFLARRWWLKRRSNLLPMASSRSFKFHSPGNWALCVCGFVCSMLATPYTGELRDFNEPSGHSRSCPCCARDTKTRRPSGSLKYRSCLKRRN